MLLDANLLLYAVDSGSPFHKPAVDWLTDVFNGPRMVGLPWQSLMAFIRISTHPRASANPLTTDEAMQYVDDWLATDVAWVPGPGPHFGELLSDLIKRYQLRGNLISDAYLAALAIEHGLVLYSVDTDFARFTELRWENPLR
jgi:uncharacterized protein